MLLIGYHSTCAYKLFCPIINKVEFRKDVIVKGSKSWDWSKSQSKYGVELTLKILQNLKVLKMSQNQKMILKVSLTLKSSLTLKDNLILIQILTVIQTLVEI